MIGLWLSIAGVFVIGSLIGALIWRYGKTSEKVGRVEGDLAASQRRNRENADVMQKQDDLAAAAAQRVDDAAVAKRLSDGSF